MPTSSAPHNWNELLLELKKLTALIAPLEAILAQEGKPGVTDRIDRFIQAALRIADQMDRAVTAMEGFHAAQSALDGIIEGQKQMEVTIKEMARKLSDLSDWLGVPPPEAARRS